MVTSSFSEDAGVISIMSLAIERDFVSIQVREMLKFWGLHLGKTIMVAWGRIRSWICVSTFIYLPESA